MYSIIVLISALNEVMERLNVLESHFLRQDKAKENTTVFVQDDRAESDDDFDLFGSVDSEDSLKLNEEHKKCAEKKTSSEYIVLLQCTHIIVSEIL